MELNSFTSRKHFNLPHSYIFGVQEQKYFSSMPQTLDSDKTMIPTLKSCYVLLNRNFLDLRKTSRKKNNLSVTETENCEETPNQSKISDRKTSSSKIIEESYKLRNKKLVNYSDDMNNREDEASDSEFSSDISVSSHEEQKRKKCTLSKRIPKKLSCLLCNISFSTHSSYSKHKRSHEYKPYKCLLCYEKFRNRQSFFNHMKKLHPEVEPFLCEYPGCEQNFKSQKLLEIHKKLHWRYMCKYCKKLFIKKDQMKKHVLKVH